MTLNFPGSNFSKVVDLSLPLSEDFPSNWPAHMPFQHKTSNWFVHRQDETTSLTDKNGPYATKWMVLDEHTGTHMDAPSHFIPPQGSGLPYASAWGSVSSERVPLTQLMGPAAVIEVALPDATPGHSPIISRASIESWEEVHGELQPGDIVLLASGWDRNYLPGNAGNAYAYDAFVLKQSAGWPAPDEEAIDFLLGRGILCIGTDGPTMGPAHGGQGVHVHALGSGAVLIECLANLNALPPRGSMFMFLPIALINGTGAPGRAIGLLP